MTNTYKIELSYYDTEELVCAETAGKAKYKLYLSYSECYEDFPSFLRSVKSCRCLRKARKEDYYRYDRDFDWIKNYRGVPLVDYGTEVELRGDRGFIIGCNSSCNFDVQFDRGIFNCHPNSELVYFGIDGEVLYDFRKESES